MFSNKFFVILYFLIIFAQRKRTTLKTQNDMIHAQNGDPYNFSTKYEIDSYKIEYKDLHDIGKEGPLCGKLLINDQLCTNDKLVNYEEYNGFGGPFLITNKYLYTTIWQWNNPHNFNDIIGALVAEINLEDLSIRLIGKKQSYIHIVYINDNKIYYFDAYYNRNKLKSLDINEDFKPRTFRDTLTDLYQDLKYIFFGVQ